MNLAVVDDAPIPHGDAEVFPAEAWVRCHGDPFWIELWVDSVGAASPSQVTSEKFSELSLARVLASGWAIVMDGPPRLECVPLGSHGTFVYTWFRIKKVMS